MRIAQLSKAILFKLHAIWYSCNALTILFRESVRFKWERERDEAENGDYGYVTFSASIILIELCRPVWVFESIEMQKYPQVFSEDRTSAVLQIIHRTTATKIHFTKWIAGCCLFDMNSLCVVFIVLLFCFGLTVTPTPTKKKNKNPSCTKITCDRIELNAKSSNHQFRNRVR